MKISAGNHSFRSRRCRGRAMQSGQTEPVEKIKNVVTHGTLISKICSCQWYGIDTISTQCSKYLLKQRIKHIISISIIIIIIIIIKVEHISLENTPPLPNIYITSCSFVRYFFHHRYFCMCGPMADNP